MYLRPIAQPDLTLRHCADGHRQPLSEARLRPRRDGRDAVALNGSLAKFLLDDRMPPARLAELRSVCAFAGIAVPVLLLVWLKLVHRRALPAGLWSAAGLSLVGCFFVVRAYDPGALDGIGIAEAAGAAVTFAVYLFASEQAGQRYAPATILALGVRPLEPVLGDYPTAVELPAPRARSGLWSRPAGPGTGRVASRPAMAEIEPLRALHYDLVKTGGLQPVVAPPYDVIDADQRAALEASSPYNVVRIDLPRADQGDPYEHAAELLARWQAEGAVVRDEQPALWPLEQDYTGPDGQARTRRGFLARVRVEDYGPGRIRPHERTHPGPKEDRLRLTRATAANLSPIFSLFSDPAGVAWEALQRSTDQAPWAETTDPDGTVNRLWRVADPGAIGAAQDALRGSELLIADGHHRYETARVYAEEVGGDGAQRYVLMCLVSLQDPGLTVFPTHRLVRGLRPEQHEELANAIRSSFEVEPLSDLTALAPEAGEEIKIGYIDAHFRRPFMLTLKGQAIADAALADHAEAYRRLDTAVLEALILKGALAMSDEDIDHMTGLGYARDDAQAVELVQSAEYDAAFLMAPTPIERVQAVASAGESMPPKSTYFFPKVPTGLVFSPLNE